MKTTPSLLVSLAAKPNDHFTLIFPTRDSVTFSTGRHKFDINVSEDTSRLHISDDVRSSLEKRPNNKVALWVKGKPYL